jgi:hypothetical protein
MTFLRVLRTLGLRIAMCVGVIIAPLTANAQTDISLDEAQLLAFGLVDRGQPAAALELIAILQSEDRNQTASLFIARSRAERALGQFDAAIASGRAAFRVAETDGEKFLAARVIAQALSSAERRTSAQYWLRRAAQFAPDDRTYAIARQEFGYVRSRNALSYSLNLSAQPTDNINNAPRDNTYEVLGLIFTDPTAVPISGTNFQASGVLTYRLPATDRQTSQISLSYSGRRVALGSDAATIDPDLDASALSTDRITAGWSTRILQSDTGGILDGDVNLYSDWSGGTHVQNGARAGLGYTWQIVDSGQSVRLGATYDAATRLDNATRSFQSWGAQSTWTGRFEGIGSLQVTGAYTDVDSQSFAVARSIWALSANYALPEPVFGANLSLALLHSKTTYDEPLYISDPRKDDTTLISLRAAIGSIEVMGFSPVLELNHERVRSNVTIFDTEASNLSLSVQSQF